MGDLPPGWDMKDFKTIEIPPEHKVSLGATFKYLEETIGNEKQHEEFVESWKRDDLHGFKKKLEERKKEYDKAFTQGFTPEQLKRNLDRAIKGDFQDDYSRMRNQMDTENELRLKELMAKIQQERRKRDDILRNGDYESKRALLEKEKFERDLAERKRIYRESGKWIDFNKERTDEEEDERMQNLIRTPNNYFENRARNMEKLNNVSDELEKWVRNMYRSAPEDFIQKELKQLRDINAKPPDREASSHGNDRKKYEEIHKESDKKLRSDYYHPKAVYSRIRDEVDVEKLKKQYPNDSSIAYTDISFGADIEAEQVFQKELHGIVDEMKVKLVDEKKILEGTLNPEYGKGDWGLPQIERVCSNVEEMLKIQHIRGDCETADGKAVLKNAEGGIVLHRLDTGVVLADWKNELSNSNPVEEQWKSDSQNGSLITDLTPTSTHASSSSFSTVESSSPSFPTVTLRRQSTNSLTSSCQGKSDDCGNETDAMNECFECTVPTISAAMHGTPNEARWLPPQRSIRSSDPNLLDARS